MSTVVSSADVSVRVDQQSVERPTGLLDALAEVAEKQRADVIRFRTCCADPRASK
jgi:hypothetical protein